MFHTTLPTDHIYKVSCRTGFEHQTKGHGLHTGTDAELRGCVNDVYNMRNMLIDVFEFNSEDIDILVDAPHDEEDSERQLPTGKNIKRYLTKIVSASESGDVLFLHFSGHGTQVCRTFADHEFCVNGALEH